MVLNSARECQEVILRDVGLPELIAVWSADRYRVQVLHDQDPGVFVPDSEYHWQAESQNERPGREEVVIDADKEGSLQSVDREEELIHAAAVMPKVDLLADRLSVFVDLVRGLSSVLERLCFARGRK